LYHFNDDRPLCHDCQEEPHQETGGDEYFQTSIILFYVSIGCKKGATIPILEHRADHSVLVDAAHYINPLPHVLMLTAIVVSVSTFGVALALALKVYRKHKTLEEDEILMQLRSE
jgi:multicomponent Na+:H+ antiporter subunit C